MINFQVRKSLQDLKWAGAHFLFLRVVLRSSLTEFAPSPSGWPARTIWRFSTFSSGASRRAGCCGFSSMCRCDATRPPTTPSGGAGGCVADDPGSASASAAMSARFWTSKRRSTTVIRSRFRRRDWIGRCAARPTTGGLREGSRKSWSRSRSIGQTHFEGRLGGLENDSIVMETTPGKRQLIPLALVTRARLEVEF